MTRTAAEVISEWRAGANNNDDGQLASAINYYIATEVTPGEIQWAKKPETEQASSKVKGEDAWVDELFNSGGHKDHLRTILRAFAANLKGQLTDPQPSPRAGEPPTWEQIKSLEISKDMVQRAARGTGVEIGWRLELFTANLNTMLYDAIHALAAATAERTPLCVHCSKTPAHAHAAFCDECMRKLLDGRCKYPCEHDADRQPPAERREGAGCTCGSMLPAVCPSCWATRAAPKLDAGAAQESK